MTVLGHTETQLDEAFDRCCTLVVREEQNALAQGLARAPELAQALEQPLQAALTLSRVKAPSLSDAAWKSGLERLLAAAEVSAPAAAPAKARPARPWLLGPGARRLRMALASLVVVFALVFSGAGTALAAGNSLPGDTLYPVKTTLEATRLQATRLENRPPLHLQFAWNRLGEIESLLRANRQVPVAVVQRLDDETQVVVNAVQSSRRWAAELSERAAVLCLRQIQVLEEARVSFSAETARAAADALATARQGWESSAEILHLQQGCSETAESGTTAVPQDAPGATTTTTGAGPGERTATPPVPTEGALTVGTTTPAPSASGQPADTPAVSTSEAPAVATSPAATLTPVSTPMPTLVPTQDTPGGHPVTPPGQTNNPDNNPPGLDNRPTEAPGQSDDPGNSPPGQDNNPGDNPPGQDNNPGNDPPGQGKPDKDK